MIHNRNYHLGKLTNMDIDD